MKLKQSPEDFQVEELTTVVPEDKGAFAFYRMEKRGWATPDAFAAIMRDPPFPISTGISTFPAIRANIQGQGG